MASLPKGAPESEQRAGPPDQSANVDREATALLTPAPYSSSTGDAPTVVDYKPNPSDAVTMMEAGPPRSPVPSPAQSDEPTLPQGPCWGSDMKSLLYSPTLSTPTRPSSAALFGLA